MSAEILPFTTPPTFSEPRRSAREYDFAQLVALVGLREAERRTQVEHLRLYAEQAAMPLPKNLRKWRGRLQRGPAAIGTRSRWCALEIDAWLEARRNPPPAALALVPPVPNSPNVRAALHARALQLAHG